MANGLTFEAVRAIGRRLPGVEEGTTYGSPALKVGRAVIACMASHKSAEQNTLAVRVDDAQRDALIAEQPMSTAALLFCGLLLTPGGGGSHRRDHRACRS